MPRNECAGRSSSVRTALCGGAQELKWRWPPTCLRTDHPQNCRTNPSSEATLPSSPVNLANASLEEAHLQGANLEGAILEGANLAWADLTAANFEGAELTGARLEGTNLKDALHLRSEQLACTIGSDETKIPPGFDRPNLWSKPPKV